jgi:superfamily I DNA and/or RNA helicase
MPGQGLGVAMTTSFYRHEWERLNIASWTRDGRVYFIRHTQTGLIKIGHAVSVKRRMSELQTMYGSRLAYLGSLLGSLTDERALHEKYAQWRINSVAAGKPAREWFIPTALLIADIKLLCDDFDSRALTAIKEECSWRVRKRRDLLRALEATT